VKRATGVRLHSSTIAAVDPIEEIEAELRRLKVGCEPGISGPAECVSVDGLGEGRIRLFDHQHRRRRGANSWVGDAEEALRRLRGLEENVELNRFWAEFPEIG
jgi:hypothetical protein